MRLLLIAVCVATDDRLVALNWDARIFKIDNFLADDQADAIVRLGHRALTRQTGDDSWKTKQAYSTTFFSEDEYHVDGEAANLLLELENRIDRLTMIPQHDHEGALMFTRQMPGVKVGSILENQVLRNVHHDKNMRERRAVTILVYLSSATADEGGRTVFPCLMSNNGGLSQLYDRFREIYDSGGRVIDGKAPKAPDTIEMLEKVNDQCLFANRSQVFSVQPRKGTALIFWHTQSDGAPNHLVWHAACQQLKGEGRYAIQKFKEFPAAFDDGNNEAEWDALRALESQVQSCHNALKQTSAKLEQHGDSCECNSSGSGRAANKERASSQGRRASPGPARQGPEGWAAEVAAQHTAELEVVELY